LIDELLVHFIPANRVAVPLSRRVFMGLESDAVLYGVAAFANRLTAFQ